MGKNKIDMFWTSPRASQCLAPKPNDNSFYERRLSSVHDEYTQEHYNCKLMKITSVHSPIESSIGINQVRFTLEMCRLSP
jgi:hypothetical protein